MAKFIGRQQEVGIAREATRGTIVTPTFWVPKVNYTTEDKAQKATFQGNYGSIASPGDDSLVSQKWSEGDLEPEAQDKIIGLLLYAMFGSLSSATFASVKKHTLTVQESVQPTTLSLFLKDPIGTIAYAMAMVNSVEFSWELGELVKARVNFIAKAHKDFTAQTPTYTAQNKFAHNHLIFKIAADAASLDAASKINLQSLTLRIERSVIRENALGTVQPIDILSRSFKISGTIKLTHEDRTYRNYMLDGNKKAIRIDTVNSAVTIGSTNPAFRFDIGVAHFDSWEPAHPLEDISTQEISFEALYDVANSKIINDAYVVNETTSY